MRWVLILVLFGLVNITSSISVAATSEPESSEIINYEVEDKPTTKVVVDGQWQDLPHYLKLAAEFCKKGSFSYFNAIVDNRAKTLTPGTKVTVNVICYQNPERVALGIYVDLDNLTVKSMNLLAYFSPLQKGDLITWAEGKAVSNQVNLFLALRSVSPQAQRVKVSVRRSTEVIAMDVPIFRVRNLNVTDVITWLADWKP